MIANLQWQYFHYVVSILALFPLILSFHPIHTVLVLYCRKATQESETKNKHLNWKHFSEKFQLNQKWNQKTVWSKTLCRETTSSVNMSISAEEFRTNFLFFLVHIYIQCLKLHKNIL